MMLPVPFGLGVHYGISCLFCFADDIVLLAPCASALRKMLSLCTSYAASHGLIFNTEKTQLICFRKCSYPDPVDVIVFNVSVSHSPTPGSSHLI